MTTMRFYLVPLPRCVCGKPGTVRLEGSGNTVFEYACCDRCGKRRVKELTASWAKKSTDR